MVKTLENIFYVYRYIRLDTNTPFYVGKSSRKRALRIENHNIFCKRIIEKHGFEIEYIFEDITEEQAFAKEIEFIRVYKDLGYCEANHTSGGEGVKGYKFTEEHRQKLSVSAKKRMGKDNGAQFKEVLRVAHSTLKDREPWNKGCPTSNETKKKQSIARMGKKPWNKGRKELRQEVIEKNRIKSQGKVQSQETIAKRVAANTGKKRSEETKLRMSMAQKKRFKNQSEI